MQNQDWEELGENIRKTVQNAIDSQDFNKLNQTINNTINDAVGSVYSGIKNVSRNVAQNAANNAKNYSGNQKKPEVRPVTQAANLYAKPMASKMGGIAMTVLGITFGSVSAVTVFVLLMIALFMGVLPTGFLIALICMGMVIVGSGILLGNGLAKLGRTKRFSMYLEQVRTAQYCDIKRLCEVSGKSSKKVIKDLNDMISRRWFKEGHLDEQQTCLITSNQMYSEYQKMMEARRLNAETEQIRREAQERQASAVAPEVREILEAGNEYILKIHSCNNAIPGIAISEKISRMEELIDRIFDRVEQDPSSVNGIHRMMDYYLPTTVKLLEAYEQLDGQPIQGENIISSKQEIEQTLDTLNSAFEKLLDDLFERTAWDVSSDISVLNTMLAQEGLKQDDFQQHN